MLGPVLATKFEVSRVLSQRTPAKATSRKFFGCSVLFFRYLVQFRIMDSMDRIMDSMDHLFSLSYL